MIRTEQRSASADILNHIELCIKNLKKLPKTSNKTLIVHQKKKKKEEIWNFSALFCGNYGLKTLTDIVDT